MIYRMGAALMSLVGVFVSAYLYLYKIGRIGTLACGTGGCETVQTSLWSRFLGVEVALIGLVGYALLFVVAWSHSGRRSPASGGRRAPRGARRAAGCCSPLYLTYLELFVIHAICRWCVGSAAIILSILILALLALRRLPGAAGRLRCPIRQSRRQSAGPWRRSRLGALGVVYGDIGTSPLYALKECFWARTAFRSTQPNVLGILSLIFWSLNFVVTFKYLTIVMRADNRGEGGILALLALVRPRGTPRGLGRVLVAAGLFGAALLYGDGIITPAISVLSAVEGLSIATPALQHLVVPIAFVIILGLFFFQRRGTAGVGAVFGPVTLAWFLSIAALGISGIARQPSVLRALNPWHALDFFLRRGSGRASRCWRPSSWSSPAARRCTRTWVTSAGGRSGSRGSWWCCPRWCSTTSARARCCWPILRRRGTRSTRSCRPGDCIRWWGWRPRPRSSPRRRSSPARSR